MKKNESHHMTAMLILGNEGLQSYLNDVQPGYLIKKTRGFLSYTLV